MDSKRDRMDSVFSVATGCDTAKLALSSAEGFLLSRIDGATPWRYLRQIGGRSAEQVDDCLERWLVTGWIEEVAVGADREKAGFGEALLDEALDLDLATQRRILEFEASLNLSYPRLLGVEPGADPQTVKRAYYKLSREFHPDRYFRRQIGSYGERLDRIFKKILEAYEILSDPALRVLEHLPEPGGPVREREIRHEEDAPARNPSSIGDSPPVPPERSAASRLERLKQRMPFKLDHATFAARRARADQIYSEALRAIDAGRLREGETNIRIAIRFDPARGAFKEALARVRMRVMNERAGRVLADPMDRMSEAQRRQALRSVEETLLYRPHDFGLNERAARLCLGLGRLEAASDYVGVLLESAPESSVAYALRGRIREGLGDSVGATSAFERAIELDGSNLDARTALDGARVAAQVGAGGGRA